MIKPETRGDPESPLRWICKSTRALSAQLTRQHHPISYVKVGQLLREQGFSLQGNRKVEEGGDHPDRDAQFRYIPACAGVTADRNTQIKRALDSGMPVISVGTKKKELLGNYANKGQQWRPKKTPRKVNGHDFPDPSVPRAHPYGIYDLRYSGPIAMCRWAMSRGLATRPSRGFVRAWSMFSGRWRMAWVGCFCGVLVLRATR